MFQFCFLYQHCFAYISRTCLHCSQIKLCTHMYISIHVDLNIASLSIDFALMLAEHCEGKSQLPWKGPAEEWAEQTGRKPLLREEATSRSHWAAGKEETVAGTYFKQFHFSKQGKLFDTAATETAPLESCLLVNRSTRPPARTTKPWRRSGTRLKHSLLLWSRPKHPLWGRFSRLRSSWSPLRHK